MKTTTGNKRLDDMIRKAVEMGIGGGRYMLDCYMGRTIRSDISHTITTRTATDNNTFIMEIEDEQETGIDALESNSGN